MVYEWFDKIKYIYNFFIEMIYSRKKHSLVQSYLLSVSYLDLPALCCNIFLHDTWCIRKSLAKYILQR